MAIVLLAVVTASFAPLIAPYDPLKANLREMLRPPSLRHPLGTDELGRDILSRIIYGSRISLTLGVVSVGIGLMGGLPLGAVGAYYGGAADLVIMRFIDILLAFPAILLAIVVVSILGPGLYNAMIAVGVAQLPIYARLIRSVVLSIKEKDFVEAARALGAGDSWILFRHIVPNAMAPIIVQATLNIASAILSAAALGFLGLGAQPPTPEWGTMLSKGRVYLRVAPHVTTFPGLAILLTVLGFNLLGDGLRDALDPRMVRARR
jgi:peptide/nickel transport system permease protein